MTAPGTRSGAQAEDCDDLDVEEALALVREPKDDNTAPAPRSKPPAERVERHRATQWRQARESAARTARSGARRTPVSVPLSDALGLVLATPLDALTDLPSFDTSAMDGWAVAGPGPWQVRGAGLLAGHAQPGPLADGEAVRIATGARIPADTTAVLRTEHGRTDSQGRLHAALPHPPDPAGAGATPLLGHGQDIRPRGQECRRGDQLLPVGTLVTPAVLGLAAAAGYDAVTAVPRPRAEVLILGDELLTEGLPHDGLIRDALGPMVPPWLRALGAEVVAARRIGDDAQALYKAITTSDADLIVTTGGTAAGPVDHVHPTLDRIGAQLLVDGVKVRPGHPMLLARTKDDQHLVGLPGNPLAAVSGLLTLAEPLLRTLAARPAPEPYTLPLRDTVQGHPYDTRLIPVVLRGDRAVPLHYNGPAMLRGIAAADALAVVPPGGAAQGAEAELLDLPWATGGIGVCFT
ncbi:molybdopterin molybdenumtransferase MoeA [Streptomyces pluripotens]|uniref:Molybdopterin molybdenumtransferase n=1 Tax=Streptomyces pluripotens TaxID=1355015 RepID=A0A221NZE5_9ACTN|nr:MULTISPECIES: molybdopterin molybdotransferase MoeA [Streptomyces]ARP71119.1 molybdopterin molybdenumtransferase MoeA [Streptomyces pluripotens]ASN25367.1 molybdopterin molybdenumtransferase MoeA [Streptomyces pluripotens]KIE26000.1 molybdenum cofactor biosynthesis protein MoeA [Streptomyces sp. MUSC 125]MCH0557105.1 molybdopterin molybdotransferase MoeA [Streptomyces sp. MUM 16J]